MDIFDAMLTDALQYTASTHSPCIGICDHAENQYCSGCHRHHSDVENWRDLDAQARHAIWQDIPKTLAKQKAQFLRLPLNQDSILQLAKARLDAGGCWMLGGLYATKSTSPLTAISTDGTIKFRLHEDINMRALLWAPPAQSAQRLDDAPSSLPLLLVVARARIARGEGAHQKPLPKHYRISPQANDSIRISTSPSHQRIESALATAERVIDTTTPLLPDDLILPASYALGLTLLP